MDVPEIKPIQLTPAEADLRRQMEDEFEKRGGYTGQYAERLFRSLYNRRAIPEIRLEQINKPQPGGRSRKSYLLRMEEHGYSIHDIVKDWSFVDRLRYFINGPSLPQSTIEGFRKIMTDDAGTSGEVMDQLCRFVRAETRKLRLSRAEARDEFWKLAKEAGYDMAEIIRESAGAAGK
jgi:hypothetical protein